MRFLEKLHEKRVLGRRIYVLSRQIADLLPPKAGVLDVGCGSGEIAARILSTRTDVSIRGIDVHVRPGTAIPVEHFDGHRLPCENSSIDAVLFVDVLHHTKNIPQLIAEAARVSRAFVIIKDHLNDGFLSGPTLAFMDRLGNARFGVRCVYNYLERSQWLRVFDTNGLKLDFWNSDLSIYPWPLSLCFDRSLHFIARLKTA